MFLQEVPNITLTKFIIIKQKKLKWIKWTNKWNELNDVPIYNITFLKHEFSWHWIESICRIELEDNLVRVKV